MAPEKTVSRNTQSSPSLRIGDLLIREGFVTEADIEKALAIQKDEKSHSNIPLGRILVNMGVLSEDDLESALQHPKLRKYIGSLAIDKGLISKEDLEFCLTNKKKGELTGEVLVNNGFLTNDDVHMLLKEQINSPKLGELLREQRLITDKDLQEALRAQKSPRALGEILCELKLITPENLNYILEKYNKQVEIDSILLKLGFADEANIALARSEHQQTGKPVESILLSKKIINQEQLQIAYAKKYNIAFKQLEDFSYAEVDKKNLCDLIRQKYAEKHHILPIKIENNQLTVALCNPEHLKHIADLGRLFPHIKLSTIFISQAKFEELFAILYNLNIKSEQDGEQLEEAEMDFLEIDVDEDLEADSNTGPVYGTKDIEAEELVNFIIKYGILNEASDIHFEQDRGGVKLRFRIDGILQNSNIKWLDQKLPEKINAIISRIKVMSNLDIAEKRLPQDGVFRLNYYDKASNRQFDLDFRVAICKVITGENLTIRILDSRKANVELENLGHASHVLTPFKRMLKSSAGMILVTGPTGSGKSSTLYGALRHIHQPGIKIITAEDPIEYSFPGIMQTQVMPKIGLSFSKLLRSFLRFDPDVILVGEIRDNETAAISFDAAQTGHLMLSTLHTNDSIGAIQRLLDLGVEYPQIASGVLCVLAQRLVRRICPFCKKDYIPEEDEWGILYDSYPSHLQFFKGEGCNSCNYSGYKGRVLLSEIFVIDKEIGSGIIKGAGENEIRKMALEAGMKTMLEGGLMKLSETTLYEILRTIPYEMIDTFKFRKSFQEKTTAFIDELFGDSGSDAAEKIVPEDFVLSMPDKEEAVIEQMFEKYKTLSLLGDRPIDGANSSVFKEFIIEHFTKICEKYRCGKVVFTIKNEEGRANISALPDV